ncbi:MAG: phage head-tail adapter protein [Huintestinicola sp.]|uniref:phage head-tail adapter protein n=1 Tax=Huintestinicola sp. TaxID=2981661 RepID=UPI003EFF331A
MNKEWSELNKTMQTQLKKRETFSRGIDTLLMLRSELKKEIFRFRDELSREELCAAPFINADGYHSKTIAYSLWHIFRIEDITAHTLIAGDEQVFFGQDFQSRIKSSIITTGNELVKEEIVKFSEALDIDELYAYISEVDRSTSKLLRSLSFDDMKIKVSDERRSVLESLNVVSSSENARWLIDYWCGKDSCGLIKMPLSRHPIMHIEACLRIEDRLRKLRLKG